MSLRRRRRWHDDGGAPRLPAELMQRIALYIPEPATFFCFLESFHLKPQLLGNLWYLWDLGQGHHDLDDLWPELHVHSLTPSNVSSIQAMAHVFSVIHFHETFDLDLLHHCVSPTCTFTLRLTAHPPDTTTPLLEPVEEWYDQLSRLPILELRWARSNDPTSRHLTALVSVLSSMSCLQCLELSVPTAPSIGPLLRYVASSTLVDLSLQAQLPPADAAAPTTTSTQLPQWTAADVQCLAHWLRSQPVQTLYLEGWSAWDVPQVIMEQFYAAIWANPTLWSLGLHSVPLPHLDSFTFSTPLRMTVLALQGCELGPADMKALSQGLEHSAVTDLDLTGNPLEYLGVEAFASVLPHTKVETVKLVLTQAGDRGCAALAAALPLSRVVELHLAMNLISSTGAVELANVLPQAPTLSVLRLQKNCISAPGAAALIQALGQRRGEPTSLDLRKNTCSPSDLEALSAMVARLPPNQSCTLLKHPTGAQACS